MVIRLLCFFPSSDSVNRFNPLTCLSTGISLRKVEKGQQREGEKGRMDGLHDVASILARRVAMEISDSESGSESGSGSDWDDETR